MPDEIDSVDLLLEIDDMESMVQGFRKYLLNGRVDIAKRQLNRISRQVDETRDKVNRIEKLSKRGDESSVESNEEDVLSEPSEPDEV